MLYFYLLENYTKKTILFVVWIGNTQIQSTNYERLHFKHEKISIN